ncbi:hypothetical protein KP509_04G040400 [Ceratopteris richardii]|uniref:Ureidoglycolate hydrolase n=1 Tax=Ceratopteris richardii TaxID=49495 RepID=A0A8T2UWB5_CERRI|nr:hypothetical protein KP509_04G040400 [Ceratopteris richardii]
MQVLKLKPTLLTPENFRPYGQVIGPSVDGALFGSDDAQLHLSAGIPRFYIMRLENRPLKFSNITHHASVSQCLGSIGALPWYIGVAKPSIVQHQDEKSQENKERDASAENIVQSHVGHYYVPPDPMEVKVFRVEGPQFLKFNVGTWHAGPLFKEQMMDFYNLELSNTNWTTQHTNSTETTKSSLSLMTSQTYPDLSFVISCL